MLKRVLPHVSIVCSLMLLVLYIINLFNDAMGFLRGPEFEFLLFLPAYTWYGKIGSTSGEKTEIPPADKR